MPVGQVPKITNKFLNTVRATLWKNVMERISCSLSSDITPGISNFIWAKVTQLSESHKNTIILPIIATLVAKG